METRTSNDEYFKLLYRRLFQKFRQAYYEEAPDIMAPDHQNPGSNAMLNFHIGGKIPHPDWKIFNISPREYIYIVGDAKDLHLFADEFVQNICASHILEHLSMAELTPCLRE